MARTFSGLLFYNASQINITGTTVYTRNAAGDYSYNQAASQTVQYQMGIADLKRPFTTFPAFPGQGTVPLANELQEVFGTAAGGPGDPMGPGFSGTPAKPWGVSIIDAFAVYSVGTNPLSAGSVLGLYRQKYAEGVANGQDVLINAVAITLTATASATTCHVFKSTLAQPLSFESLDNSDIVLETILITPAGGTARMYGLGLHVAVEYT